MFSARYLFELSHLFILDKSNPFSAQTFFCLLLLTGLVASMRAEYGVFAILLDRGSGGMTVRLATPFAILVSFMIAFFKAFYVRINPAGDDASTAFETSLLAIFTICLVMLLGWRTRSFEARITELSLRDELTGLYNRRGFFLLAGQAFQLTKRLQEGFWVVFIDLDNLKRVNDTLGHDCGSELIKEVGELLLKTFREDDVIGRVGGDEFVIAGRSSDSGITALADRIREAIREANAIPGRTYQLAFSLGIATSSEDRAVTLEGLVAKADVLMYEQKLQRRSDTLHGLHQSP